MRRLLIILGIAMLPSIALAHGGGGGGHGGGGHMGGGGMSGGHMGGGWSGRQMSGAGMGSRASIGAPDRWLDRQKRVGRRPVSRPRQVCAPPRPSFRRQRTVVGGGLRQLLAVGTNSVGSASRQGLPIATGIAAASQSDAAARSSLLNHTKISLRPRRFQQIRRSIADERV